ncbi:hypothetical protein QW131_31410 [Roseibium salinum]|nr:hypothetical protein [Roseibium salinum]
MDDYTVRFTFKEPYGDFLAELASPLGQHPVLYAKHYCSQFLPTYNDNVDELIAKNEATDWQNLFLQKVRRPRDPGSLGQSGAPDAGSMGDQGALCRWYDACRAGAQSLFLADRYRG